MYCLRIYRIRTVRFNVLDGRRAALRARTEERVNENNYLRKNLRSRHKILFMMLIFAPSGAHAQATPVPLTHSSDVPPSSEAFTDASAYTVLPRVDVFGWVVPEYYRFEDPTEVRIKREQMEEQPEGFLIKDVIKRLPGVFTGGGPGEDKDARLRGLDKEFSRVEFDGVQLPDGGEKRELNIDRIPLTLVEEIKFIRNTAAEYEADGIAGRIHIETRPIPTIQAIKIGLAVGDEGGLGTAGSNAFLSYGNRFNERFGLQGAVNYFSDPLIKTKRKYRANGSLDEFETEDKPTDYLSAFWDTGFFYDGGELHIKPLYLRDAEDKDKQKTRFRPDGRLERYELEEEEKVKRTRGVGVELNHRFTATDQLDLNVGYYHTTEDKDKLKRRLNQNLEENRAQREIEYEDKTDQFWQLDTKMTHQWQLGYDQQLKYGIRLRLRDRERTKQAFRNNRLLPGDPKSDYYLEENYYAGFVQNKTQFTEQLSILAGLRTEYVTLEAEDGVGNTDTNNEFDWLPSLSATYRVNPQWVVYAAASRVLNRPKFDELSPFENTNPHDKIIIGNPQLSPARAWAFEAGFNYVTPQMFLGFNAFYRAIQDVIESRPTGEVRDGKPVEQVQNVGDGYVRGIELEQRFELAALNIPILAPFSLTLNQSFIDSELENNDGTKNPFKEQPDFIGNIILNWQHPSWGTRFSIAGNYVSSFDMIPKVQDGRESEFFWDAKITQEFSSGLGIYLLAKNITDEQRVKQKQDGGRETEKTGRYVYLGIYMDF